MPMGSQAKATDPESFEAWASKIQYDKYIVQYKLDGASLELQYDGGILIRAVTRGDGIVGMTSPERRQDAGRATHIAMAFSGGVRGEVLMSERCIRKDTQIRPIAERREWAYETQRWGGERRSECHLYDAMDSGGDSAFPTRSKRSPGSLDRALRP